jgi:manganese/iron transport system permease protein/iron/zinc/copper transport system permease protein
MMMLSALFGVTGVVGGLYFSLWIGNVATGPSIVIATTLQFLVVLCVAPRYGLIADWWRRRSTVPQTTIEDILGCFRYTSEGAISINKVVEVTSARADEIQRAIRSMIKQELLVSDGSQVSLTEQGRSEAKRLIRAHRLWETYLQQLGTPTAELHDRAHELEHLHDEETVDYLDDKLGHPLRDPHGALIPEDFVHLVPGAEVKSSLLREGRNGIVTQLDHAAAEQGIEVGMRITAGRRSQDGREWSFILPNHATIRMGHEGADAVIVRLEEEK